jgi:SAM-dependent methyltransferase
VPIDRVYIEEFLAAHSSDVRGRVLEVSERTYTERYGRQSVSQSDVLHAVPGNPLATFVADLADGRQLPSSTFDCIICTQTLQYLSRPDLGVATLHRILKPGGVLLISVPGISRLDQEPSYEWHDYWRFTPAAMSMLLGTVFGPPNVEVDARGNVLAAIAFLHGLAAADLEPSEQALYDPNFPVSILARAVRSSAPSDASSASA